MLEELFSCGFCYDKTVEFLSNRCRECPTLRRIPMGKSSCGRRLPAVAIGSLKNPVLFAAGFSADDRVSVLLLLRFLADLTDPEDAQGIISAGNLPRFFDRGGLILLPMINPDGFEIAARGTDAALYLKKLAQMAEGRMEGAWRSSATGVDLTKNFDLAFDYDSGWNGRAGEPDFPGSRPESEAETKALIRLCSAFHLKRAVEFRTPGEAILPAYGQYAPPNARISGELIANSCGYRLPDPAEAFERGSFKDWFAARSGREGYTIKAGRSNPVPEGDLEPLYARLVQTMLLCMVL